MRPPSSSTSECAAEDAARSDHERAVDKVMGEVRALFPMDRARCDVIFPEVDSGARAVAEDPTPTPAPTPKPA